MLNVLENFLVTGMWRLGRVQNAVEMLDDLQRVLVGGIAVEKLVLHQTGESAKFGNEFAKKLDLVHGPQHPRDLSFSLQDRQKRVACLRRNLEGAVHQFQVLANL